MLRGNLKPPAHLRCWLLLALLCWNALPGLAWASAVLPSRPAVSDFTCALQLSECALPTNSQAYLYTGEQIDPDLGMYYLRARYYQPGLGRFWSLDSYEGQRGNPLSLHKYLYCHGNPVNGVDPSGHEFSLGGISASSSIGSSIGSFHNGVVASIGRAMQATLFGVQSGMGANDILTGLIFDETGIGLGIDAFNAVKGLFQDRESQEVAAYILWRERLVATILAAMEDSDFGEITVEFEPQCFVAGTLVATETGLRPLDRIKPGDKVWAWNEATDEVRLRPVVNRFIHRRSEVFEIKVGRDVFKVTGEHPFFVAGKGWTPAREVRDGAQFITREGRALVVNAIEKQGGEVLVYNFEVSTDHNYYVGEEGILTHNANALRSAMGLNNPALAAHHIVAIRAAGAQRARDILRSNGINLSQFLNSAANGVGLPRNLKVNIPPGFSQATVHSIVHTTKYYKEVERRLMAARPGTHITVVQTIGKELRLGVFPYR
jgi:RHS repeat-associated protein